MFAALRDREVEVHVRSVFLQGLFFLPPDRLGNHFDLCKQKLSRLQELAHRNGISVASLCLGYVLLNEKIRHAIIGVDSPENLSENLDAEEDLPVVKGLAEELAELRVDDLDILLPYRWPPR
jgi:aryl-alcohol dehydrogenase-like predicted oxidoreductase